ncbi:MAG: arylsulfatase [Verrucomicrobiae bacterium]|nr:arylsulfatase [Verrucomicrobiae bacterium]
MLNPAIRLTVALAVVTCGTDALAASRPNILIILADDLGFSDLGCYGGEIATPNLDTLAQNGLRFTQAYNTSRCWPSRACILTGYYAQQVRRDAMPGVPDSGARGTRPRWAPLITEFLRPAGYRCYHSGKWHIDGHPLENGFDRSFEILNGGYDNYFSSAGHLEEGRPVPQTPDYYVTRAIADHAIRCLREHAERFPDRPFFHYLCFTAPHFPLHAPPEDIARYADKYLKGWNALARERHQRMSQMGLIRHALPEMERHIGPPYHFPEALQQLGADEVNRPVPWEELTESQRRFQAAKMAIHAAMIERMDREIGRVLDQLRAMDAWDNTLILFASDNGASAEIMVRGGGHDPSAPPGSAQSYLCLGPGWSSAANTPLRRHKTWAHEGGIATPLIVHWPAGLRARGQLRHDPVHLMDVAPTVLEVARVIRPRLIAGVPPPPWPAKSLLPAFKRNGALRREFLWWLHEGHRALRAGHWKIVADANADWELYDLARDRGESRNLAAERPDTLRKLAALWEQHAAATRLLATRDLPPAAPPSSPKPAPTDAP